MTAEKMLDNKIGGLSMNLSKSEMIELMEEFGRLEADRDKEIILRRVKNLPKKYYHSRNELNRATREAVYGKKQK